MLCARSGPCVRDPVRPRSSSKSTDSAAGKWYRKLSTKAGARVDSFAGTTSASSWFSLQAKLRMVVRQNAGRSHVKLQTSKLWIFLYLLNEFIGEGSSI